MAVVSSVAFSNSASAWEPCTARQLRARGTETIALDGLKGGVREHPAYYLRDAQRHLVFFLKPEHVVTLLEAGGNDYADSLERMRRDLPLKEDTDLFKYGVRDIRFYNLLDDLVAKLLDAGHAMVDFFPLHDSEGQAINSNDRFDPVTLKRVYWNTRAGEGRTYCSEKGSEVLSVVDVIND